MLINKTPTQQSVESPQNNDSSDMFHITKHVLAQKYLIGHVIGRGRYSTIYYGIEIGSKQPRAVKFYNLKQIEIEQGFKVKEIVKRFSNYQYTMIKSCASTNVVKLYDIYEDSKFKIIISEYCNQGTLKDYIRGQRQLEEINYQESICILRQILQGLKSIHTRYGHFHKNLQPQKILIKNGVCKLIDLGISPINGSIQCLVPELIVGQTYDEKTEVWNIGLIFYFILFAKKPDILQYSSRQILIQKKLKNIYSQQKHNLPKEINDFLQRCLYVKKQKRISWRKLQNHAIFSLYQTKKHNNTFEFPQEQSKIYQFKHSYIQKSSNFFSTFILPKKNTFLFTITTQRSQIKAHQLSQKESSEPSIYQKKFNIKNDQQQLQKYLQKPYERLGFLLQLQSREELLINHQNGHQNDEQNADIIQYRYYWVQILKIQEIIRIFLLPLKFYHQKLDEQTLLKFIYLVCSRCFSEVSKLKSLFHIERQTNKYLLEHQLTNKINFIYHEMQEKMIYYSKQLTKKENSYISILKAKIPTFFNLKHSKNNNFFQGLEKMDYQIKDQIKFTKQYYQNQQISKILDNHIQKIYHQTKNDKNSERNLQIEQRRKEFGRIESYIIYYVQIWQINNIFQAKYDQKHERKKGQQMKNKNSQNTTHLNQILTCLNIENYIQKKIRRS